MLNNNIFNIDFSTSTTYKDIISLSETENDLNYDLNSKIFPFFENNKEEIQENLESEDINIYLIKDDNLKKNDNSKKFEVINKKRGRKKTKIDKRRHNSDSLDNLLRKLKVHYLSFIISFINDILEQLKYKFIFYKLNYDFKQKSETKALKKQTIREIICQNISRKYTNEVANYNKILLEEIQKNNKVLYKLFSENYLQLFKKIYFKSKKIINLREYGLDKTINLSNKVKMYDNLLLNDGGKGKEYRRNMDICVKKHFIPKLIFTVN